MKKKEFMTDPIKSAKELTGMTRNCLQVQRLIAMVSSRDIPDDAIIHVATSSDWRYMQRRAMYFDRKAGKNRLAEKPRFAYCYGWDRIAANGSGGYCRPWTYAMAMMEYAPEELEVSMD